MALSGYCLSGSIDQKLAAPNGCWRESKGKIGWEKKKTPSCIWCLAGSLLLSLRVKFHFSTWLRLQFPFDVWVQHFLPSMRMSRPMPSSLVWNNSWICIGKWVPGSFVHFDALEVLRFWYFESVSDNHWPIQTIFSFFVEVSVALPLLSPSLLLMFLVSLFPRLHAVSLVNFLTSLNGYSS